MERSRWDCLSHWSSFRDGSLCTCDNPDKAVHDWNELLKLLIDFGIGLVSLLSKAWQAFNPWHLIAWYDLITEWMFTTCFDWDWLTCMSLISAVFHSLLVSARSWVMLLFLLNWTCLALDWFDIPCWARCMSCLWMHTCLTRCCSYFCIPECFHLHLLHYIHCIASVQGESQLQGEL